MNNLLIEASAGTGKTQELANRMIALLREGVKPQEIVALTFSRAAAGEIFGRFVSLLANQALTSHEAATTLRGVLATQHLSQVGTLDSFLLRIVRAFPQELGIAGDLRVMDAYERDRRRAALAFSLLRRTDGDSKRRFVEAFGLAKGNEDVRSYVAAYRQFVQSWHRFVTAYPESSAWGDAAALFGGDPAFLHVSERELDAAADGIAGFVTEGAAADKWRQLVEWVRRFRGRFGTPSGFVAKVFDGAGSLFSEDIFSLTFNRRTYVFTREQTCALRDAVSCVCGYAVRRQLELARGIYAVVSAFEAEYDRRIRRRGLLVFDDVPRLIGAVPDELRLSMEFRLDAKIRAWALDEFQDTSRDQWRVIENLVDEARQSGGEKSVFVVGDRKQAIYGWRDGDVSIFERERDCGLYLRGELKKTYRSGPDVVSAVNRVFAQGRIASEFPAWECPVHESAHEGLTGFVRVVDASGSQRADFVEPVFLALKASLGLSSDDPRRRRTSAAVLVRDNKLGNVLADGLRALGLEGVALEGETRVLDTPALSGFLDLVQLADHPGDAMAYRHFLMTPLARAKYPDGAPSAEEISLGMSVALTSRGLVRTLRELRALLPDDAETAWSKFTEESFTEMLRAAAEFERGLSEDQRLSDFSAYLGARRKRTVAEPGKIRVMTIHRSKGLGFDYVVLPLYEHESLTASPDGPLLGDGWILPDPGERVLAAAPALKPAFDSRRSRAEQESLCTYYVAMTRAKRAMTIVLHPASKSGKASATRFSDLVRSAELGDLFHPEFAFDAVPRAESAVAAASGIPSLPPKRGPRLRLARRLPSLSFATGVSAGSLFASAGRRDTARRRGVAAHRAAAGVEFSAALPRPDRLVALWREKPFEVYANGEWTSGRFDRVTFFRDENDELCAEVVDFKSSLEHPERHDRQLAEYRLAVAALAGIPPSRVTSRLVAISDVVGAPPQ